MVDISLDRKVGGVVSYFHCVIFLLLDRLALIHYTRFSVDHSLACSTVGRAWRDDRMLDHTSNRPSTNHLEWMKYVMNPEYIEYRIHDHLEWMKYVMNPEYIEYRIHDHLEWMKYVMNPEYIEYRIHDHLEWITYVMIHTMLMKPDYRITCHIIRHACTGFSSRLIYVITVDDTRLRVRYTEA